MFVHTDRGDEAEPSGSLASGWVQPAEVHALAKQLAHVLSRLDPNEVPASRAPELWRELRVLERPV